MRDVRLPGHQNDVGWLSASHNSLLGLLSDGALRDSPMLCAFRGSVVDRFLVERPIFVWKPLA